MSTLPLVLLGLSITLVVLTWSTARRLQAKHQRLIGLEHAQLDLLVDRQTARVKVAARLEQQDLVEQSVETGAKSAETIHKAVAGVTFGVLDAIPVTESVSKLARGIHDGVSGSIYSTVRGANKQIGQIARELIKEKGKEPAQPKAPGADQTADASPKDEPPGSG